MLDSRDQRPQERHGGARRRDYRHEHRDSRVDNSLKHREEISLVT